ncbi:MAG: chemotaxis protein CheD [Thermoanaerobaculia bacterium]|nr:chemotaxis protein CheD [Thermoanaerobaculia bacterium]
MSDLTGNPPASGTALKVEDRLYLYPGAVAVVHRPSVITTILGSCVAVCLWDPSTGRAGMNHFILPRGGGPPTARYGNHAMPMLLEEVLGLGARRKNLLAAVFGGACLLAGESREPKLGDRNLLEARSFLDHEHIPLVNENSGGREGRKLTFRTADGNAVVRKL